MNKIEKESIRIKKLGALEDVYLPEILPVTVLIGESASGKSTFRAWFCLRDACL